MSALADAATCCATPRLVAMVHLNAYSCLSCGWLWPARQLFEMQRPGKRVIAVAQ